MPQFKITTHHLVTEDHLVEANSLDEAMFTVREGGGSGQGEVEVDGTLEVCAEETRCQNSVLYSVTGYLGGVTRQGILGLTWQEALKFYLALYPERFENLEVLELELSVNGDPAVPVWEEKFYDYIYDVEIKVHSVRDPRDGSDQLVKA